MEYIIIQENLRSLQRIQDSNTYQEAVQKTQDQMAWQRRQ